MIIVPTRGLKGADTPGKLRQDIELFKNLRNAAEKSVRENENLVKNGDANKPAK
jgi:hypothetical protein